MSCTGGSCSPQGERDPKQERDPNVVEAKILAWQEKLLNLLASGQLGLGAHGINVVHESWCDKLTRLGPCSCDPVPEPVQAGWE